MILRAAAANYLLAIGRNLFWHQTTTATEDLHKYLTAEHLRKYTALICAKDFTQEIQ
jgi:hypothetical protein